MTSAVPQATSTPNARRYTAWSQEIATRWVLTTGSKPAFLNAELAASYRRGKGDARAGRVRRFHDVESMIRSLRSG